MTVSEPDWHTNPWDHFNEDGTAMTEPTELIKRLRLIEATVDRCAQVAHSFRDRFFNHPQEMADAIAAAIRAMRDEP
jgi:hypothetical protein